MILDSRITWDKLCIELELLSKEEPATLVPLLIAINSLLTNEEAGQTCLRPLNFMTYELSALCKNANETERLETLIDFFFKNKDFQITQLDRKSCAPQELLIKNVITDRRGSSILISALFLHFAKELDLIMSPTNLPELCVLRWVKGSKACYLDLSQSAQVLCEEKLVELFNRTRDDGKEHDLEKTPLEGLTLKQVMLEYLKDLTLSYRQAGELDLAHAVLSMRLKIEPNSLKHLYERALVRKDLGHSKEALQDMKRYFSFSEFSSSPNEIQLAYKEIVGMNQETPSTLH